MTVAIWKVVVPIDDQPHEFEFPGLAATVHVEAHIEATDLGYRDQTNALDVWLQVYDTEDPIKTTKRYLVLGTGHSIPDYEPAQPDPTEYPRAWGYTGTARPLGYDLVWHLFEAHDESLTKAWDDDAREKRNAQDKEFWAQVEAERAAGAIAGQLTDDQQVEEVVTLPGGAEAKLGDVLTTDQLAQEHENAGKFVTPEELADGTVNRGTTDHEAFDGPWNAEQERLAEQEIDAFEELTYSDGTPMQGEDLEEADDNRRRAEGRIKGLIENKDKVDWQPKPPREDPQARPSSLGEEDPGPR